MTKKTLGQFDPDKPLDRLEAPVALRINESIDRLAQFMTSQPDDGKRLERFRHAATELIGGTVHAALLLDRNAP